MAASAATGVWPRPQQVLFGPTLMTTTHFPADHAWQRLRWLGHRRLPARSDSSAASRWHPPEFVSHLPAILIQMNDAKAGDIRLLDARRMRYVAKPALARGRIHAYPLGSRDSWAGKSQGDPRC